jgi:hypothetical protein
MALGVTASGRDESRPLTQTRPPRHGQPLVTGSDPVVDGKNHLAQVRHLLWLLRPVAGAGTGAVAPAVYAEAVLGGFVLRTAAENGQEGVACVDDAGRALVVFARLWRRRRDLAAKRAADGLLQFLLYMQDTDGRFANFVTDWNGHRNTTGVTSERGGAWWTARGALGLAAACADLNRPDVTPRIRAALRWLEDTEIRPARAVATLAAAWLYEATGDGDAIDQAVAWAENLAAHRDGDVLTDGECCGTRHLWAHLQEVALVTVAQMTGLERLTSVARASADALIVPAVRDALLARSAIAYDASCAATALSGIARATGDEHYERVASLARAWFRGRNAAGRPVYDEAHGLVYDGVDDGRVSRNAGAESNIEGALGLLLPPPMLRGGARRSTGSRPRR